MKDPTVEEMKEAWDAVRSLGLTKVRYLRALRKEDYDATNYAMRDAAFALGTIHDMAENIIRREGIEFPDSA